MNVKTLVVLRLLHLLSSTKRLYLCLWSYQCIMVLYQPIAADLPLPNRVVKIGCSMWSPGSFDSYPYPAYINDSASLPFTLVNPKLTQI